MNYGQVRRRHEQSAELIEAAYHKGRLNVDLLMEALLHDVRNCTTVEEAADRVEHFANAIRNPPHE